MEQLEHQEQLRQLPLEQLEHLEQLRQLPLEQLEHLEQQKQLQLEQPEVSELVRWGFLTLSTTVTVKGSEIG